VQIAQTGDVPRHGEHHPPADASADDRITVDPAKLGGQPCIRGDRLSVEHLLELLAADWTVKDIQADLPFVEPDDVRQALKYAAALVHRELYLPLAESA
jgi:uncharacterized protein (DUF433 family)